MGRLCAVIQCSVAEGNKLHLVPKNDPARSKWMEFINKANQRYEWKQTKQMYVCDEHFGYEDGAYDKRKRSQNPTLVHGKCIIEEPRPLIRCALSQRISELEAEIRLLQSEVEYWKRRAEEHKIMKEAKSNEARVLKQKLKRREENQQDASNEELLEDITGAAQNGDMRTICAELLARLDKPRARFSDTVKQFAYKIHYFSPRAYEELRTVFQKTLPHAKNFLCWTKHISTVPGFLPTSLQFLKDRNKENTYVYALSFDEIHIRRQIIHHQWEFYGFVNYGGILPENNDSNHAEHEATAALFMVATEVNGNKKIPLGYILTKGLPHTLLAEVIRKCIIKVTEAGGKVLSFCFDGLRSNIKAAVELGAKINLESEIIPYIINPITGAKVFVLLDPSHMAKLLRNVFKDYGAMEDETGNTINWNFVENLHRLQITLGLRAANKLSQRHVMFEKQKMKTKLCTQLFSNSVSVALGVCRHLKIEGFEDSEATERFLYLINRLFDHLNSRPYGKGFKAPLTAKDKHICGKFFTECSQYLRGLKIDGKELWKTRRGTPIVGLIVCMASVKNIFEDPTVMYPVFALPLYRLSQDPAELLFSVVRSRFGFNNNPNCMQLLHALRGILCMKIEGAVTANCLELDDLNTKISPLSNLSAAMNDDFQREDCDLLNADPIQTEVDHIHLPGLEIFSQNVVYYIAGYVGRKLCSTFSCSVCLSKLFPSNDDENLPKDIDTLFIMKQEGGLFRPSLNLFVVCRLLEQVIRHEQSKGLSRLNKKDAMAVSKSLAETQGLMEKLACCIDTSHSDELFQGISLQYLKLRFHHIAKEATLQLNPTTNRNLNTKMVLFTGN